MLSAFSPVALFEVTSCHGSWDGCCCYSLLSIVTISWGDEPFRYTFTPGTTLKYVISQEVTVIDKPPQPDPVSSAVNKQRVGIELIADELLPDGATKLRLMINRVELSRKTLGDNPMLRVYDSASQEQPKDVFDSNHVKAFQPMIGNPIHMTISPRGEVRDVIVPAGMLAGYAPGKVSLLSGMLTSEPQLKKVFSQYLIPFPEEAWQEDKTVVVEELIPDNYAPRKITRVFNYAGPAGATLDRFRLKSIRERSPAVNDQFDLVVSEHDSTGDVLFDHEAGWIESYQWHDHDLQMTTPGDQTNRVHITPHVNIVRQRSPQRN
jgi:hypothetical protein